MKKKLAIICATGLDNFLDWAPKLEDEYEVKVCRVTTYDDIYPALRWGDIIWLEWANEVAVEATRVLAQGIIQLENIRVFLCGRECATKKVVVRLHSYEAFTDLPTRINWHWVDRLVFVAEHVKNIIAKTNPSMVLDETYENGHEIVTIPNGVDVDNIEPLNPGHGYNIAVVGSINYKKNPPMVLQVLRKLVDVDRDYQLYWAGQCQDPRYEVYLNHMVKEMDLGKNIVFLGHVEDMDVFWKGQNYLLHTSIHEGHSYAIMEAMARGITPVIHNYYGAKEQYQEWMLFNTVDEAVEIINDLKGINVDTYRSNIINYGWTLDAQVSRIRELLGGLA